MITQDSIDNVINNHRRWMTEDIQRCGHHASHYSKRAGRCVSCPVTIEAPSDEELLREVYMPNGAVGYFGFNGGGRATDAQKAVVRRLLAQHVGNPTVDAIRRRLNGLVADGERIEKCDVVPVLRWFKSF